MKITKDMTIAQVLKTSENTIPVLQGFGLHCLGCPGATAESVEHAAIKHGVPLDEMLDALNAVV